MREAVRATCSESRTLGTGKLNSPDRRPCSSSTLVRPDCAYSQSWKCLEREQGPHWGRLKSHICEAEINPASLTHKWELYPYNLANPVVLKSVGFSFEKPQSHSPAISTSL